MMSSLRFLTAFALWSSVVAQDIAKTDGDVYCLTFHENLMRRQADEWGSVYPFTIDDGTKHTPFTTFEPETRKATVVVGNGNDVGGVYHPMVASDNPATVHFITHIYAMDQNGVLFATETMDPNLPVPATVVFDVPEEVTEMTAYEFCNLHGLWKGPTVSTISPEVGNDSNVTSTEEKLIDSSSYECSIDSPPSVAYDSFTADYERRQSLPPFNSMEPYDEDDGAKHTPYISLNSDGTANVTVGVEGNYHPMEGVSVEADENGDGAEPHWITTIYVMDQNGDIVTMQFLDPSHVDIAQATFDIPSSATTVTAYEWCNIHGLYIGPTIDAVTGEVIDSNTGEEGEEVAEDLNSAAMDWQPETMAALTSVVAALMM